MPSSIKIEEIWICPPLAFARFGQSPYPMENFHWASNDYSPRGTAETVIEPSLTFEIDANGNISAYLPEEIRFQDQYGHWRPVCPFFELHARLSDDREGPLTIDVLQEAGLQLSNITWKVEAANRKAYHYTLSEGDKVEGEVTVTGDDHRARTIAGTSPEEDNLLVPDGKDIPLGQVQVIRPNPTWPEIRLRITPPKGLVYGPTNLKDRNLSALVPETQNQAAFLRKIHCMLDPNAKWPLWKPIDEDYRTNPGGLYAQEPDGKSLGFLDDSNDGLIKVTLTGAATAVAGGQLTAYARYTCCPQDFQPDRRPFVSIADGLSNLVKRGEVLEPAFVGNPNSQQENWAETEKDIADLMQRVRETMEASNLDHQNLRSKLGNLAFSDTPDEPFEPMAPRPGHPLPLTELGRMNHARFLAYEVFKQRLAQRPELFEKWIRSPLAEPQPYDNQMPALMRGSDSAPMYITQRQYYVMQKWLQIVENSCEQGEP